MQPPVGPFAWATPRAVARADAHSWSRPMFERRPSILAETDPEIASIIERENQRQEEHIELIASENYASTAVMAAQGSQLTNKYAEGYPGKRYYGGCEFVDIAEQIAIDRVKKLFHAQVA